MILTCPECASRYFVDDAKVGPKGRTVRCAACAHSWRAELQGLAFDAAPFALTSADAFAVDAAAADGQAVSSGRSTPLPKLIRAEAVEKKKSREAVAAGVAWAGLGAGFVALVLASVLFRVDVVRLWPQTAGAYAFAKMPVNPTGLAFENVQGQPNLIGGHAALSVTGFERNVETGPRASMPLRVILYDKAGKRLTSAVSAPPSRPIGPSETRPFAVNFIDPPAEGSSFVVEFAFDKLAISSGSPKPQTIATAKLALRGSAAPPPPPIQAEDAKPLPTTSPYALPASATQQTTH
jgi:predicted Zn finger-like uncharacterized protein